MGISDGGEVEVTAQGKGRERSAGAAGMNRGNVRCEGGQGRQTDRMGWTPRVCIPPANLLAAKLSIVLPICVSW